MQTAEPMELFDLRMSEEARPLYDRVVRFLEDVVEPIRRSSTASARDGRSTGLRRRASSSCSTVPRPRPRRNGLWNFFLPNAETGEGLSNLDYAYIAVELGKNPLGSECLNCSAPDTGNMEVLERVGTPEQKEQWLEPLLDGEIRSAYAMTEPDVATSDAKNIQLPGRARRRRVGHQRREVLHLRRRRSPLQDHDRHGADEPGRAAARASSRRSSCRWTRPASRSSARCTCSATTTPRTATCTSASPTCACPTSNMLLGEGRGFEISQVRLGPGRIHHCMRSIGAAEKALELMVRRGLNREAFGKPLANLGKNIERSSRGPHRDRGDAPDGAAGRQGDGRAWATPRPASGSARSRRWCRSRCARSSTRPSRSTAPPASRSGRRWRACTPASARCAWPTARTRCTHVVVARHEAGRYAEPAPTRSEALGDGVFAGP